MGINYEDVAGTCSRSSYERLCRLMRERGGTIRLLREGEGWGLVATLPAEAGAQDRAGGFIVADLAELDAHARLLLAWLATTAPRPINEGEKP